jgi:predicted RNA methylase
MTTTNADKLTHQLPFDPDCYETPDNVSLWLRDRYFDLQQKQLILLPGEGRGQIAKNFDSEKTIAVELDRNRFEYGSSITTGTYWINTNFLEYQPANNLRFDLVVMNPPYGDGSQSTDKKRLAPIAFIVKALELIKPDGLVVALLESDYFRSKGRHQLGQALPIQKKIDIVGRLKFLINGVPTENSCPRYHSIFEIRHPDHKVDKTLLETVDVTDYEK